MEAHFGLGTHLDTSWQPGFRFSLQPWRPQFVAIWLYLGPVNVFAFLGNNKS